MTTINKIPAGYRVTSVSWENDGDHKRTIVKEGLSEKEVTVLASIINVMHRGDSNLENNFEPSQDEIQKGYEVYLEAFEKNAHLISDTEMAKIRKDFHGVSQYIAQNLTGYSEEGYALRDLDQVKIEYFPQDIIIEDVTKKFLNS